MIKEILQHGAENTMSTKTLMMRTGLTQRQIVAAVSDERGKGAVILSSAAGGYYLPDDSDNEAALQEIRACIRTIEARGRHTLAALRTLRTERSRLESIVSGQQELNFDRGL